MQVAGVVGNAGGRGGGHAERGLLQERKPLADSWGGSGQCMMSACACAYACMCACVRCVPWVLHVGQSMHKLHTPALCHKQCLTTEAQLSCRCMYAAGNML